MQCETRMQVSESQGFEVRGLKFKVCKTFRIKRLAFNVVNASLYEICTTCKTMYHVL